jgi:hypothetical protein
MRGRAGQKMRLDGGGKVFCGCCFFASGRAVWWLFSGRFRVKNGGFLKIVQKNEVFSCFLASK